VSIYTPHKMRLTERIDETPDTRTLRLEFVDAAVNESFAFAAGQFGEYSYFGEGECTFCIASSPTRTGFIECCFKAVGKVTDALRTLEVGDQLGFRGPYGNAFPVDDMAGHDVVLIAGGIGLAPVRSVIWNLLDERQRFGNLTIVYGARTVADLVFKRELDHWQTRDDVALWQTVDPGGETADWPHEVGFVPAVVEKAAPAADAAYAIICGPPIMIKLTLPVLERLGFDPNRIFTTLENRMKCGLGKCGRCNIGHVYVCKDGPVFSATELAALPQEF
jgi:NAD(P)H-flavin reductase